MIPSSSRHNENRRNSHGGFPPGWDQIGFRQCFQHITWNVLPRAMASWGSNTLCMNIIFDRITIQWNCSCLCWNCQLAPATWAIKRGLARCTRSEHLNVKMISKIKITAHPAKNQIVRHWKYQVSENCHLLATTRRPHNELTLDSPLTEKARCRHEQNPQWTN